MDYFDYAANLARGQAQAPPGAPPRPCETCAELAYAQPSDRSDVSIFRCPRGHWTFVARQELPAHGA